MNHDDVGKISDKLILPTWLTMRIVPSADGTTKPSMLSSVPPAIPLSNPAASVLLKPPTRLTNLSLQPTLEASNPQHETPHPTHLIDHEDGTIR